MFEKTRLLPLDQVRAEWAAFVGRPGTTPPSHREQAAWNAGTEAGARIERTALAKELQRLEAELLSVADPDQVVAAIQRMLQSLR